MHAHSYYACSVARDPGYKLSTADSALTRVISAAKDVAEQKEIDQAQLYPLKWAPFQIRAGVKRSID